MKYWIFDLDNTLYMTKNIIYEDIKKDYYFSDIHSAVENFTFNSSQCLI